MHAGPPGSLSFARTCERVHAGNLTHLSSSQHVFLSPASSFYITLPFWPYALFLGPLLSLSPIPSHGPVQSTIFSSCSGLFQMPLSIVCFISKTLDRNRILFLLSQCIVYTPTLAWGSSAVPPSVCAGSGNFHTLKGLIRSNKTRWVSCLLLLRGRAALLHNSQGGYYMYHI